LTRDNTLVTLHRCRYDCLSDLEAKAEDEMINKYRDAKHALWSMSEEIYDYAYDYYSLPSEWDERDLFITQTRAVVTNAAGRHVIVTSAAPQIAWLFGRLRDAFTNLGHGGLESEHYLRLGGVARAYELTSDREYKLNGILRAVMNEAVVIFEEMQREEIEPATPILELKLPSIPSPQENSHWQEAVVC
jgi:hypothetical protein